MDKIVNFRLNEEIYKKIKCISEREDRTISNEIRYILKQHIEAYERIHGQIN